MTTHSLHCTFEGCSTFCPVASAKFAAGVERAARAACRDVVSELARAGQATPYNLDQLGWPLDEIERAVRKGWIRWTAIGHLECVP